MTSQSSDQNPVTALAVQEARNRLSIYVPQEPDEIDWNEFEARGHALLELARVTFLALGALALWGWKQFGGSMGVNEWAKTCASAWGCTRPTVLKAMRLASSPVMLPEDTSDTLNYQILCLSNDRAKLDELFDRATDEGWTTWDLAEMRKLRKLGLLDDWHKPHFESNGTGKLEVIIGDERATVAWFEDCDEDRITRAGIALLKMRSKIE